jgi:hypothetical protein
MVAAPVTAAPAAARGVTPSGSGTAVWGGGAASCSGDGAGVAVTGAVVGDVAVVGSAGGVLGTPCPTNGSTQFVPVAGVALDGGTGEVAVTGGVAGVATLDGSEGVETGGATGGGATTPPSVVAICGWLGGRLTGAAGFATGAGLRGARLASSSACLRARTADALLGSKRGGSVADRTWSADGVPSTGGAVGSNSNVDCASATDPLNATPANALHKATRRKIIQTPIARRPPFRIE